MSGYHIEFADNSKKLVNRNDASASLIESHAALPEEKRVENNTCVEISPTATKVNELCVEETTAKPKKIIDKRKVETAQKPISAESVELKKTARSHAAVHPSASGSLLMGSLSAACFIMLFVVQFNPLWLVIALAIGIITFALLAKKMAKQAFDDMYYARNRYSGKGLAAAGLALGVVSMVALIGLALVMLFGLAFIAFS